MLPPNIGVLVALPLFAPIYYEVPLPDPNTGFLGTVALGRLVSEELLLWRGRLSYLLFSYSAPNGEILTGEVCRGEGSWGSETSLLMKLLIELRSTYSRLLLI